MEWLKSLPLVLGRGDLVMVHAGFELDLPIDQQFRDTVLWIRDPYIYAGQNLNLEDIHPDFKGKTIITGHTPTRFINENLYTDCPIVKKDNLGLTRYFIDGGSKGGPNHQGRINLLKLDQNGKEIWRKYATTDGISNY